MSGDESEIVYVFEKDVDLSGVQAALETKLNEKAEAWGADITVSSNSEKAVSVLAHHYTLRALIAGAVVAVLVFAYVSLRYKLGVGIVTAIATVIGMLLTAAVAILTRIPVTSSVAYVIAVAGLLSAVTTLFTMNKLRANLKSENAAEQSTEDLVSDSIAVKEIGWFTVLAGGALVIVGALAASNVRWFAILSLIGVLVAAFIGLLYAPAMYIPIKKAADKRPARNVTYKGAKKTSTKQKKQYVKAAPVEEAVAEEAPVEEVAAEEVPVEETPAEEAVTEETAE
jgi:preprotein translocase subunit SecF